MQLGYPDPLLRERKASSGRSAYRLQHHQGRACQVDSTPEASRLPLQQRHVQVHRSPGLHRLLRNDLFNGDEDPEEEPSH